MKDQLESLVSQMVERGIHYSHAISEFEKRFIDAILEKNKGNRSKAAKALGIHRNTLSRKMDELELDHRPRRRRRSSR